MNFQTSKPARFPPDGLFLWRKVDFATLLDAQRQIRQARQNQIKAQLETHIRLAEIEKLIGEDL